LQSKADSAGTETDKMQDEILKFLSEEQKQMMDNIIRMQKDSQEKDLVLNQTLKRLEDAQNQILEQSEKIESMSNVGQMQNDLMQWISEEQKSLRQFIADRKGTGEAKEAGSGLDPEFVERLDQKLDNISKIQESANKDGTNVDKMQNELIQFMQSEQKKLMDQMGKMQKEAEEKDERMKETLSRLENTRQELLTQKEQMESMQQTDELQNELMK